VEAMFVVFVEGVLRVIYRKPLRRPCSDVRLHFEEASYCRAPQKYEKLQSQCQRGTFYSTIKTMSTTPCPEHSIWDMKSASFLDGGERLFSDLKNDERDVHIV
jgi:hypothetical protein